ncbi:MULTISPECIES: ABC transporter permease subunit [unclassified Mesorhizobium]|uniref:ABC transporter permease n=1 Tax=unclassified Mesorhizobium TaxID=325217 RepID=UPI0011289C1A|nr:MULTISPECIES: ABC transporter permease subunit [unclassified Mesorhizobium]TPI56958.1 ABC transporter permease subunit [Mesorhizobium sp. B3-1-1]TPJ72187.1 ABC transporter permease subunit [Mesorhizobium sp. B2-6-7]TPJ88494.1 ABC transporter permease subunit [Mesorhizobium sp. B2-6-3]TPK03576.1 ABC transporter permease subunit [Mesorhizobium sp. B2-5-10]TPK13941.1 ABC transporter permease subunit [Mesorhizobium sp. B2-5-11]
MTVTASASGTRPRPAQTRLLVWAAALAVVLVVFLLQDSLPWAANYPAEAIVPVADWVSALMRWIKINLSWLTRSITAVLGVPLDFALDLLAKNFKIGHGADAHMLPRLSWIGVCAAAFVAGHAAGGRKLGMLVGGCLLYIALFGQWTSAMLTLALISIAVPFCIATGLFVGIWAWRKPWAERLVVSPALDLMQTIPTFAYLIPMLLLFGNSPVSAMIATAIFATPPMVRATMLGLSRVPSEIDDFSEMAGCTARQKLWRVLLPSARPTLMVGVNQVIMLALNMVIIASMIGAGGLGYDVLLALRALKVGEAMEAGLAIVALAIALDRLSQAIAANHAKGHVHRQVQPAFWRRNLTLAVAILIVTTLLGLFVPAFAAVPKAITFTTAPLWKAAVNWVTINFFDVIEAFRVALILNVLNPVRAFCEGFPWLGAVFLLGLAGYQLSGLRLAALVAVLTAFCAVTGLWEKTMATVYLCGISAFIACLIGIPIGLMAARSDRVEKVITPVIDTLQVLPSFCFIIPVVMLFRVGDVTAMIATIAFAVVPAIRYTNHGIRQVPPALIEAAKVSGCTQRQTFFRVQLPLALPEIMLGVNQTILMALAMIIICAMVGTRDLGQEVFIALSKADSGRGIVAGLAIAFIGIVADRLFNAWTAKARARLG